MGWLRRILRSSSTRVWLFAVVPTSMVFLVVGLLLRAYARLRIANEVPGDVAMALRVFDEVAGPPVILAATLVAVLISTYLTVRVANAGLKPYRQITELARQLTRGNYGARAPVPDSPTQTHEELADSINLLAQTLERAEGLRRELVANLAHEIRTPLTNLQGYLEALRDGVIDPTPEALASVHDEVLRLVRLVDALHQLARADAFRQHPKPLVPTDLDQLVEQLARVIQPTTSVRGIRLTLDLNSRRRLVPVHADSIAQVIRNLLRNAAQYTDDGGVIRIQTDITDEAYHFTCLNTGPGVPEEDLALVFNRFYRTDRSKQTAVAGVGIGLAICRELIEGHGGRIRMESAKGWTMVFFEVPVRTTVRSAQG